MSNSLLFGVSSLVLAVVAAPSPPSLTPPKISCVTILSGFVFFLFLQVWFGGWEIHMIPAKSRLIGVFSIVWIWPRCGMPSELPPPSLIIFTSPLILDLPPLFISISNCNIILDFLHSVSEYKVKLRRVTKICRLTWIMALLMHLMSLTFQVSWNHFTSLLHL